MREKNSNSALEYPWRVKDYVCEEWEFSFREYVQLDGVLLMVVDKTKLTARYIFLMKDVCVNDV